MLRKTAILLAVFAASPAYAETLSLICEHDSGVSTKTGLPNHGYAEVFRIDFDVDDNEVVTPFFAELEISFDVTDFSVMWSFRLPAGGESYAYQLNRSTGTLFVTILTADERFVATGKCTKPKRQL